MANAKKKKSNKRTPQQLEKMRQKQREAMERNTLKDKKRIEVAKKKKMMIEKAEKSYQMLNDSLSKFKEIDAFKHFSFNNKVNTVRRVEKLPNEIKSKVIQMIDDEQFKVRGCWYNSALIKTSIDGVEKVDGWYGIKIFHKGLEEGLIETEEKVGHTDQYKKTIKRIGDRQWIVDDGIKNDGGVIYDFEKDVQYNRHSWNSYNGIHFDVSAQYTKRSQMCSDDLDYRWIEYIEYGKDNSIYLSGDNAPHTQSFVEITLQNTPTETLKAA